MSKVPTHLQKWHDHVAAYRKKHPGLSLKDAMHGAGKTYPSKKKMKGGNPAIVGAIAAAVPDTIRGIGDAVDQGRKTQHEFNRENGNLVVEKEKNFQQYYRDLMHTRFWDPEKLPRKLRFPRDKTNNPKYKAEQEAADDALYEYAEKRYYG